MLRRFAFSMTELALVAMSLSLLSVSSGTSPAAATSAGPYSVATASCTNNYTAAFGNSYNVRLDVDVYNMPASASGGTAFGSNTAFFVAQAGSLIPTGQSPGIAVAVQNGSGSGFTFENLPSGPYDVSIQVQYKTSSGSDAVLSPLTLQVPPPSACGSANVTYVSSPPSGVTAPIIGMATTPDGGGYWMVGSDGRVYAYGDASLLSLSGSGSDFIVPNKPIVSIAVTPDGRGYWLVGSDGGIFTYGDAQFYGSTGALALNKPIVGMAATPDGNGYWLVASDGGIFAFGDAVFYGSTGALRLNKPVVGMAADDATGGYWLVASDGGIFSFNAPFLGSTGAITLNKPIVGMEATPDGSGYRFVASDGGVFCFGAPFEGSTGNIKLNQPVTAIAPSGTDAYWLAAQDGGIFSFNAPFYGTPA
jgi:hypothetical protein